VIPETHAHALAEAAIAQGAAELLDPGVLVGRHGLAGKLPPEPIGLLDEDHVLVHPGGGDSRGETADSAPQNDDVSLELSHGSPPYAAPTTCPVAACGS
jgi:hypothetical protein